MWSAGILREKELLFLNKLKRDYRIQLIILYIFSWLDVEIVLEYILNTRESFWDWECLKDIENSGTIANVRVDYKENS